VLDAIRRHPRITAAIALGALSAAAIVLAVVAIYRPAPARHAAGFQRKIRAHFDHAPVIPASFDSPQAVTRACLACHPDAREIMKSSHWTWLGGEVEVPDHAGKTRIGKKNLLNNFCLVSRGNERGCTKCHAGYGWTDDTFDFTKAENVDCLVCHERTGAYAKATGGLPAKGADLVAAARSVATPGRENCLACHAFGGGGQAVKHGDIDSSLVHPSTDQDVHIGRHEFLCVDCHRTEHHQISGRAFSVSVEDGNGLACTGCHARPEHRDARLDAHLKAVACQACHVPTFARTIPTKAWWDWSKAGNKDRKEDPHSYLRIKGEFTYEQDVVPEYRWFNLSVGRYLVGDKMDPSRPTPLNPPRGSISDPAAKIWPFKVHRATQPYDLANRTLLTPTTGGPGGYWTTFDWRSALALGAKANGIPFSGQWGFARTEMYWPLTHMVAPKEKALACGECHGERGRMDWAALGYAGDPMKTGGRP
jgi:octaheme c-type cytochrome (tetrathionate reductase family)